MSHEKVGSVQLVVISQDNLGDEASGLQVENEELPAFDDMSVQEIGGNKVSGNKVSGSILEGKRKYCGDSLNELCASPKKKSTCGQLF